MQNLVADEPQAFNWQSGGDARGLDLTAETSALTTQQTPAVLMTMREGNGQTLFQPQAFDEMNFTTDVDAHHVLRAGTKQSTGVMVPQAFDGYNQTLSSTAQTIRADKSDGDHVGMVLEPQAFRKAARAQSSEDAESWVADGQANTLNVFDVGDTRTTHAIVEGVDVYNQSSTGDVSMTVAGLEGGNTMPHARVDYGVRRLTPVECERLQSFPDGWTEPAGSDSARYKAMGNAVTVNVVRWILGRMVQAG